MKTKESFASDMSFYFQKSKCVVKLSVLKWIYIVKYVKNEQIIGACIDATSTYSVTGY